MQSGFAIANNSAAAASVTVDFLQLNSSRVGSTTISIPAGGQKALLLNQVAAFNSSQAQRGILRITSATPVSVMGLRVRYNERGDLLVTTTPATNEAVAAPGNLYFPHIADSGGFTTQFILFSATPQQTTYSGTVQFLSPSGTPLNLNLH